MHADLEAIIADCENDLSSGSTTIKRKLESINTIIQVKSTSDLDRHYKDLYGDVKKLVVYYIKAIDEKKYEYDFVNQTYLLDILNIFKEKEKIALYDFLIRKLKLNGLDDEVPFFICEKRKNEIVLLYQKLPKTVFKLFSKVLTYNILSICSTILLSYLAFFVILLPSSNSIILFKINYNNINSNFWINHFCNCLLAIFGLNSENFIEPLNTMGVFVLVIGKLLFILLILNICIDKFIENIKSNFLNVFNKKFR